MVTTVRTTNDIVGQVEESGAGLWKLDPMHTLVEFSAKHMMISTVKGQFTDVSAQIRLNRNDLTGATVEATIGSASIQTGVEYRDNHLRSGDFLDAENFPQITFKSHAVEKVDEDELKVRGDLTIRGITRPVELKVELGGFGNDHEGNEHLGLSASTHINRKDWGLNWNVALEAGGMLVGEKIKIEIHVEAIKQ